MDGIITYRLETTYACAMVFVDGQGKIVDAASIYRWMIRKNLDGAVKYLKQKKQYLSLVEIK